MSAHISNSDADLSPTTLPPLRIKRKLQADRYVHFSPPSVMSTTSQQEVMHSIHTESAQHSTKQQAQQAEVPVNQQKKKNSSSSRLPHMSPSAPCSLSTSIKFAEIVHRNWNSNAILPTMLSTKNASKYLSFPSRNPKKSALLKDVRKNAGSSCQYGRSTQKWMEKSSLMMNIVSFCSTEAFGQLLCVNKAVNVTLCSDDLWAGLLNVLQLTPLVQMRQIRSNYYDFFRKEVISTNVLGGLYNYENLRPPPARYSFSLPTGLHLLEGSGVELSSSPVPPNTAEESANNSNGTGTGTNRNHSPKAIAVSQADSDQQKFRHIRLLVTPATFGCDTCIFSRVHLLLRRWPPFDQSKMYLGSCRFSLEERGFLFTFLDEYSEPRLLFSSAFVFVEGSDNDPLISTNGFFINLIPKGRPSPDLDVRLVLERSSAEPEINENVSQV